MPRTAIVGGTATFSPDVAASEPVVFQWRRNGNPLPGATNLVLVLSSVTMENAGEYSLVVSNAYGTVTSSNALLRVVAIGGDEFQIVELLTNNSRVVEHESLTGDDRGGIAASATRVFYSGDSSTARFNLADLSGGVRLNRIYDGLVSNLRNGTVYTLATGSSPINVSGGSVVVDGLIELDGSTGLLTARRLTLSTPITLSGQAGIFSGYDRIVLHSNNDGQLFHISLPDGAVTELGFIGYIPANYCQNWAYWGVAEFLNHDLSLAYVYGNTVARSRLSGGPIETIAPFNYLGGMCSFTVSLPYDRWYFHHEWQSQFGGTSETLGYADAALRSPLPPNPVQILIPPINQTVLEGGTAIFNVSARGTRPFTYQWQLNGTAVPGATNSTLVLSNVTASMAGGYSVAVSNAISGVVSAAATLRIDPVTDATFQVAGLFPTGSRAIEHDPLTSDDRGGIAASASQIFISGDAATARFNIEDLSGGVGLGRIYNAMVSNLRTETVYTLANGGTPLSASGGVVSHLAEIDGVTGALRPNRIVLSTSITLPNNNVGIFAGWDRIVLHTGSRAYQILLPSGQVNDLGAMAALPHMSCETWAYWGVAEFFAGSVYLVAVRDPQTITRTRVPDGLTTELARFSYLGDMCSITVTPYRNRWYFHHEGGSEFGGFAETLGFADARFVFAPILPRITSQPRDVIALDGGNASFRVAALGGAGRLSYQWRFNDGELAGETNDLLRLPAVTMSQAGNYSVVVSNSVGAVTSQVAQLTIRTLQGFSFRVTGLSASQCAATEHGQLTGDDRGGIAASSTHVFYSGDFRTARFLLDDLSGGTSLDQVYDTLVSNLRTEQIYALANDTGFLVPGGVVTRLVALDGVTALPTGAAIELSQPIPMGFGAGIFAGFDRVVLYNGLNIFNIDLPSGVVSDLGPVGFPNHHGCENWAFWGIAEYFDGGIYLVYVRDTQSIVRTRVSDGATSTVASFNSLSDMCSITFSLTRNRWYFHHEGGSQFGSGSEMVGYCDATWDQPNTLPVVTVAATASILEDDALLDAPVGLFDGETTPGALSVAISTSNPDLLPLDHISLSGTGTNRLLRAMPVANAYGVAVISVALTDAHGATSTSSLELTVQPVNDPPALFKGPDQAILEDAALQTVANWASEVIPGPPNEAGQAVEFLVSNDNPALFEVQPAIAPNGSLSFKPAPNAHGIAHVTAALHDNGGTQNGGQDTAAPQSFQITVQPVNDPPVAQSQSVLVSEDGSLAILLGAQDIDGDPLSYSLSAPAHGTLSGTPPALIYTPGANYFGGDSFTFTVSDGQAPSGVGTVSITVGPINDPPSAAIDATSPSMLATNSTNYTVIAPDNAAALVILEGWRSSDIENDSLQYFWLENETPFAHGVVTSNLFEVGTHVVTLTVSDGADFGSTAVVLDVIAPSQAVESLLTLIDDAAFDRQNKRPMIATLKAAAASLDRGQFLAALNQLRAFQNKVRAQIAPAYPAEAARWIQAAEDILSAMGAQQPAR